jgi:uncharacterized protein
VASGSRKLIVSLTAAALAGFASVAAAGAVADAAMRRDMAAVRTLLEQGEDANAPGAYGTPALHWIVRVEDVATAGLLLDAGADPNVPNRHGVLPLHIAIDNSDARMVDLLLASGADFSAPDGAGETPLLLAARVGDVAIAQALIARGAAIDAREPHFGQTPLMVAVREGHAELAALLIAKGADVDAQTLPGETPRFRLPSENAGSKGVGIIRGGWPERGMRNPIPGAKTPLLYATREGYLDLTRMLVDAGASLEKIDANGVTPLINAIVNGSIAAANDHDARADHLATARLLVERGANVNAADWYGQTPLWAAVDLRNLDVNGPEKDNGIDRGRVLELIELLLERGADPNARTREYPPERRFITPLGSLSWVDFTGQTPFLRAALAGDLGVMRLLLEHGADASIPTYEGTTPLMAAAGVNWVVNQTYDEGPDALLEAVRMCLVLGNDIDAVNSMGLRAIHGAANRGSNEIIEFLATNGAELDVADNEGRTPLVWAEGVFLATHPPERKPEAIALLTSLLSAER